MGGCGLEERRHVLRLQRRSAVLQEEASFSFQQGKGQIGCNGGVACFVLPTRGSRAYARRGAATAAVLTLLLGFSSRLLLTFCDDGITVTGTTVEDTSQFELKNALRLSDAVLH